MRCALLAFVLLASIAAAANLEFAVVKESVLEERLRQAHKNPAERFRRLAALYEQTGCIGDAVRRQPVRGSKEPNLICDVAGSGESARRIIVGAHFDSVGGDGVIDNWSGAILLPSLAAAVRMKPRRHTFEFVGFAAEEKGLLGSEAYLKAIPKPERKQIAAVVTMDSLGLGPVKCWPNSSTGELVNVAALVASAMKIPFTGVNVDRVGSTDSMVFKEARIPVLSLHSVTQANWTLINAGTDVWKIVSWRDYYETHRMISALLVYLDETLP
jgi:hypothetical protein